MQRAVRLRTVRALVTGSGGFVGSHLVAHLRDCGDSVITWSGGTSSPDITDRSQIDRALGDIEAASIDAVFHLAAGSRVDLSWEAPAETIAVNAGGTANLLRSLADVGSRARVVVMSSAEVYGIVAPAALPVTEQAALAPRSPYGVSKLAAEQLAGLLASASNLEVVICRPFNQIGPGQASGFVVPSFAQQVVANELSGGGTIEVGNLGATRDFLDVRDAVTAYRRLAEVGESGHAYNVASGREVQIRTVLDTLIAGSTAAQSVVVDDSRFRPNDLPRMVASIDKLTAATGWTPTRRLDETLNDVLGEWRSR